MWLIAAAPKQQTMQQISGMMGYHQSELVENTEFSATFCTVCRDGR